MRILLDANMGTTVATFLESAGHDVMSVATNLPPSSADADVARFAITHNRHIITADRGFTRELELAAIDFPHAIVTLRAKNLPESPGTWLWLLSVLLLAHPAWENATHYVVDPDHIRIRKLKERNS